MAINKFLNVRMVRIRWRRNKFDVKYHFFVNYLNCAIHYPSLFRVPVPTFLNSKLSRDLGKGQWKLIPLPVLVVVVLSIVYLCIGMIFNYSM